MAQSDTSSPVHCPKCRERVEAGDTFCRHCGRRLTRPAAWFYEPVWILALAFLVVGPFALVLVWKSPKMGREMKVVFAVAILAYSAFCAYSVYFAGAVLYRQMKELDEVMRQAGTF